MVQILVGTTMLLLELVELIFSKFPFCIPVNWKARPSAKSEDGKRY